MTFYRVINKNLHAKHLTFVLMILFTTTRENHHVNFAVSLDLIFSIHRFKREIIRVKRNDAWLKTKSIKFIDLQSTSTSSYLPNKIEIDLHVWKTQFIFDIIMYCSTGLLFCMTTHFFFRFLFKSFPEGISSIFPWKDKLFCWSLHTRIFSSFPFITI